MKKKRDRIRTRIGPAGTKKSAAVGAGIEEIRSLIARMAPVLRCAVDYGTFAGERDLLECPGCGLVEDTDIDGRVLTYIDGGRMKDSGYRFVVSGDGTWICPVCHTVGREDEVC
jgi:hypothetical protein